MNKLTTHEFIERSTKIHNGKYDYSKSIYNGRRVKLTIICSFHGEFLQTPDSHLDGKGCSECGGSNKWNSNKFIEKARKIHRNKYCYDKSNYVNGITPLTIICPVHGEFNQTPGNHLSGKECKKCVNKNIKLTTNDFILKANKIHENKYDYSKTSYGKNQYKNVIIICKIHGDFLQDPTHHLRGQGCVKCTSNISNKERKFLDFIKIPDTKENRQKRILKFSVDGMDNKTNTIYEFLGDYFHGNPRRFNPTDYNKACHKTFGLLYENTFKKLKILKDNGYTVKYIWEMDWDAWNKNKLNPLPIKELNQ